MKKTARAFQIARSLVLEKVPLFALAAGLSALTFFLQNKAGAVAPLETMPWSLRLTNALASYALYAWKTVYPLDIAVYYPMPEDPLAWWTWTGASLTLVLITGLAVYWGKSRKYFLVGWLLFLGVLFPVMGVTQSGSQGMAARFMYIPAIGLYIIIIWGLADVLEKAHVRRGLITAAAGALVLTAALLGYLQTTYWANGITLLTHSMQITGKHSFGYEIMGGTALQVNDYKAAAKYLKSALQYKPDNEQALMALSFALEKQGKLQEAVLYAQKAVELNPDFGRAKSALGALDFQLGRREQGLEILKEMQETPPNDPTAMFNMGLMHFLRGDYKNAASWFRKSVTKNPALFEARTYLGAIAVKQGRTDAAILEYLKAIEKRPDLAEVHNQLGLLYVRKGLAAKAAFHFEKAHALAPDYSDAAYNLAYLDFRVGNLGKAERLLRELLAKEPESPDAVALLERIVQLN